jgi:RimJ/RimL family protein N-acetyltransferase
MEPVLVTDRLALRQFTPADAGNLLDLDGDPAVMRFLTGTTRTLAEIESQVLPGFLAYYQQHENFGFWAADTRSDGQFIGWFGLRPVTPAATAIEHWPDSAGDTSVVSLGYRLRQTAWGRGYATEGARALVSRAITELGVEEIVATTMAVNTGSRRVLEKAGLAYTRTVYLDFPDPLPGNEHGDVEYRLHRRDYSPCGPYSGSGDDKIVGDVGASAP